MLTNLIVIENGKNYQFDNEQDLVKSLLGNDYYELPEDKKMERIQMKLMANSLNSNKISDEVINYLNSNISNDDTMISTKSEKNIKEKKEQFSIKNIKNEKDLVLYLVINNCFILLEKTDSNIFTGKLDKSQFTKNYILVNKFAKQLI